MNKFFLGVWVGLFAMDLVFMPTFRVITLDVFMLLFNGVLVYCTKK